MLFYVKFVNVVLIIYRISQSKQIIAGMGAQDKSGQSGERDISTKM